MRIDKIINSKLLVFFLVFYILLITNLYAQRLELEFNITNNFINYSIIISRHNNEFIFEKFPDIYDDPDLKILSKDFFCTQSKCTIAGESFELKDLFVLNRFDFFAKENSRVYLEWKWEKDKTGYFTYKNKKYYFKISSLSDTLISKFTDRNLIIKEMGEIDTLNKFILSFESCVKKKDTTCIENLFENKQRIHSFREHIAKATVKMTADGCEKIKLFAAKELHIPLGQFVGENNVQDEMLKNNYDKNIVFSKFELMLLRMKNKDFTELSHTRTEWNTTLYILDENADKKNNCEDKFNYSLSLIKINNQWNISVINLVENYLE